jgi:hypothetical protein
MWKQIELEGDCTPDSARFNDNNRATANFAQSCNGAIERANRTHTEEFYQDTLSSLEMKKLNRELR